MALKDTWVDKVDGVDMNSAEDINMVAQAVIEIEKNGTETAPSVEIVQTIGNSETAVMSQKSTTEERYTINGVDLSQYNFNQGGIGNGTNYENTNRCSTWDFIPTTKTDRVFIQVADGYKAEIDFYNANKTYISYVGWLTTNGEVTKPQSAEYIKVVIAKAGDKTITPDIAIDKAEITLYVDKIGQMCEEFQEEFQNTIVEKDFLRIFLPKPAEETFYVEFDYGEPSLYIKFDELRVRGYSNGQWVSKNYTTETLASECNQTLVTTVKGIENCLKIKDEYGLVYDLSQSKFQIVKRTNIKAEDYKKIPIILSESGRFAYCISSLLRVYTDNENKKLEAKIEAVATVDTFELETSKIETFATLFNGTDNVETFMYFTDPHLCMSNGNGWRTEFDKYMLTLRDYFKESAVDRVFCGGDWLGSGETEAEACYRLGLIDSTMRSYFAEYHNILGNHDTNYQGAKQLSNSTIRNLFYRKQRKAWFAVNGVNTKFFVFDTQTENEAVEEYETEQINWYLSELQENTTENIVLLPHIVFYYNTDYTEKIQPLMTQILNISKAYNDRESITVDNVSYDFSNAVGKVRFVMSGHTHLDLLHTINDIPIIATTQLKDGATPTFDLCLADYDNNVLKLVRVGTGEDREINI